MLSYIVNFFCCLQRDKKNNKKSKPCECVKIITSDGDNVLLRNNYCSNCILNEGEDIKWIKL
jgi:hypothetical protein